jgi:hypothetical protein
VNNTYFEAENEVSINNKMSGLIISLLCNKLIIFLTNRHWFVSVDIKNIYFVICYNAVLAFYRVQNISSQLTVYYLKAKIKWCCPGIVYVC